MEEVTYEEFIQNILNTRGRFNCGDEYHERHHIVPKCCGGTNDKDNLIDLFAREHFIAHKLLAEENPDNDSLILAYTCMAFVSDNNQCRYELTQDEYEAARITFSQVISKRYSGSGNPMFGKIGEKNPFYGKKHSDDSRKRIKENHANVSGEKSPMYGRTWWNENTPQEKIDEWRKNIKLAHQNKETYNYGTGVATVQLTADGDYVAKYVSASEAEKITGINASHIRGVYNHKKGRKTAGGYLWVTEEEYNRRYVGGVNEEKMEYKD